MPRRTLLPTLCAVLALASLSALPASAPAAEVGVNAVNQLAPDALDGAGQAGAHWIRAFVRWDELEPSGPGSLNAQAVGNLDTLVAGAQARGMKVVAVVLGAPGWANLSTDPYVPPVDPTSYGDFLGRLALRYKGRVAAWEIWNEPDEGQFWHGTVSPDAYTPLLKAAYAGAKAADPAAMVLAAASTGNDYPFLEGIYAAGGGGSFDGVAVHTDTACLITSPDVYYRENGGKVGRFSFLGLRSVHEVLVAHGDGAKPIVMTEIGWSATSTICGRGIYAETKAAGITEAQQAAFLKLAYRCLSFYPYVKAALWFSLKDAAAPEAELNRYGLIRSDGSRRPAFDAFAGIAKNGPPTTGACGDFAPPGLKILSPKAGQLFDRSLPIKVAGTDATSKLGRVSLYANGVKIRSFTGADLAGGGPVGLEWMGARNLPYGDVTITIEVLDEFGNTTREDIVVRRVDPRTLPAIATKVAIKVKGKGLQRKVTGRLVMTGADAATTSAFPPGGKVVLEWQIKKKGKWVTLHKRSKNAAKPFTYAQRLRMPGRWRVQARYLGEAPFQASKPARKSFSAR